MKYAEGGEKFAIAPLAVCMAAPRPGLRLHPWSPQALGGAFSSERYEACTRFWR